MPTCVDYGISRHFSFAGNGFFFCHGCDIWDSIPPDQRKKSSRTSARLACTAKHTSFSHPTTLRKDYCKRGLVVAIVMDGLSDDDSIISTDSTGADNEQLQGQNSSDAATHASDDSSAVSGSVNLLLHPIDNNQPMQLVLDTVENNDVIVQQLWERIAMLENQHLTLSREVNRTRQRGKEKAGGRISKDKCNKCD